MKKKILWITRTGLLIALLVAWQAVTAPLQITLVTGAVVNLILIVAVMTCGLFSGIIISAVSPFMAFMLGIGVKFPVIIPLICLGNLTLVLIWHIIANRKFANRFAPYVTALVAGAVGKFVVLYVGVVKIAAPLILDLPAASPIYLTFSYPQLITALIGGVLATLILPTLKKFLKDN